jgi:hypothetical protein
MIDIKIASFIWFFASIFAVFLSFKCNNGFSVSGVIFSLLFSPLYIINKLIFHYKTCFNGVRT